LETTAKKSYQQITAISRQLRVDKLPVPNSALQGLCGGINKNSAYTQGTLQRYREALWDWRGDSSNTRCNFGNHSLTG